MVGLGPGFLGFGANTGDWIVCGDIANGTMSDFVGKLWTLRWLDVVWEWFGVESPSVLWEKVVTLFKSFAYWQ